MGRKHHRLDSRARRAFADLGLDGAEKLLRLAVPSMDPTPLTAPGANSLAGTDSSKPSRHRRIHKEVGAVTGISFADHPKGAHGVIVSLLKSDGACARSGVRVGDHITKINGERPTDAKHAVTLCDQAWIAQADGQDKNKDRLKFSLHLRTQDFSIGGRSLSAGTLVNVEALGSNSTKRGLLGTSTKSKLDEVGLRLEDSPSGYGALVASVEPDSPAHVAGIEAGLTIVSVDDTLCPASHASVLKMLDTARSKKGNASLVCHLKKSKEDEADHV